MDCASFPVPGRSTRVPASRSQSPSQAPRHLTEAAQSRECRGPNPTAVETGSPGPPTRRLGQKKESFYPGPSPRRSQMGPVPTHLFLREVTAQRGTQGASEQRRLEASCQPRREKPGPSSLHVGSGIQEASSSPPRPQVRGPGHVSPPLPALTLHWLLSCLVIATKGSFKIFGCV